MSRKVRSSAPSLPWSDASIREVRQLRRAITAEEADKAVEADVAPMMGELLARLEVFAGSEKRADLRPPGAPDPVDPPGPEREAAALSRAAQRLRAALEDVDEERGRRIAPMLRVLERHLQMKREIVARAESGGRA